MRKIFAFINQKILRGTKEQSGLLLQNLAAGRSIITYFIRTKFLKSPLKLKTNFKEINIPIPSRWSNPNFLLSLQALFINVQQVWTQKTVPVGLKQSLLISQYQRLNPSISNLQVINALEIFNKAQIDQLKRMMAIYKVQQNPQYTPLRQVVFADSLVSGQHIFNIRKYGNENFDLATSLQIDRSYRKQLQRSLNSSVFHEQNLKQFNLTKESIIANLKNNYTIYYEDVEKLSQGSPIENKPIYYTDNVENTETYVLQASYPVFTKINFNGVEKHILLAIGFRYNQGKDIRFISPFFGEYDEKIWRLAQSQTVQCYFIDFHMRVHLGTYHFSTAQYNVPLYNFLNYHQNQENKRNYENFIQHAYTMFNRGLEGVNLIGTCTLTYPIPKYSLLNQTFNFKFENLISDVIAPYSNRIDFTKFSPRQLTSRLGVDETNLPALQFDFKLYDILSDYVKGAYQIFQLDQFSEQIRQEINKEVPNMSMGTSKQCRPIVQSKEDVVKLITNLVYCWVGYHAHTFTNASLGLYWYFRPTALLSKVPYNPKEWQAYQVGDELPNNKILMSTISLAINTSYQNVDTYLIDYFEKQLFRVNSILNYSQGNSSDVEKFIRLRDELAKTVNRLATFTEELNQYNLKNKDFIKILWMNPNRIQASLNI